MPFILLLSGSPSSTSRSNALLDRAQARFVDAGIAVTRFGLRDFPPEDLLFGKFDSPVFDSLKKAVDNADAIVVATPVYKAAYTAGLKAILDILPQTALRGKIVLPLVSGGSPAHQLAIDYALKPVLSALGATDLHQGVYFVDKQLALGSDGQLSFGDEALQARFEEALLRLITQVNQTVRTQTSSISPAFASLS